MFICDLFKIQKEIDGDLLIASDLSDHKLSARRNLELHIKVSALAEESKCYAYTTKDQDLKIDKSIVFKKYMACIHQIISIGIGNNYSDRICNIDVVDSDACLSDQFLNLYIDINDLIISKSEDHFITLFEDILSIGKKLGFTEEDIISNFKNSI